MTSATLNMLAADKLNGNNYASWKNTINTVLIIDDLRFVLVEECPQVPAANATRTVREPYERWAKANEKARAYILASLSEVLAKKHESVLTAREIMDSLQEMFGQASYQIKHDALKYIYNARMNEGASVREHVLNMMVHFHMAEMNGAVIDEASQVSFILESLPESFLQFRSNAVMNKIAYTLTTLLNELQTFESLMKIKGQKGEANVATSTRKFHRGSTSGTKSMPSSSGNKKWKKKKGGQGNKANLAAAKTTKKAKAAKGICFHCNQEGHWKRNCPKYLAEKKKAKQALEKFKEYKAEVENALSKTIKTFRSDRAGEYMDLKFQNYLMECGIVSQLSAPGTPQQNGVSERRNRTLWDMVRSMMSYAHLPNSFWGYAVQTAVYILNCVPSKSVFETPLKLWNGRKGSLRHFRIWGCLAHVLENNPKKLEPRSKLCLFVGYPKGTRGGYFYDPKDNKVFVSTNATFLEEDHIREHKPRSKIVLNELSKETTEPSTRVVEEPSALRRVVHVGSSTRTHQPQSLREPRRSGRVTNLPIRYMSLTETLTVISDGDIEDPLTFKKAMEDVDKDEWIKAMNLELDSMYFNSVWDLVDQPDGVKPIGCKWIYKRKRGADGKVQTFQARLVAKGYTQVEGVDYEKTFSPVAMLKSIRILLSIAAYFDYEIWQMDVKTAFLNGNLEETIYMQQPEGFIIPGQEQKICKLNRSIYGLKQASRSWNIRFDTAIKSYGFDQIVDEPCVYKRIINKSVAFLVLYVDDILLIENDIGLLTDIKQWLATQFQMKDLGEAQFVLGIQIFRDRKNKMLALSQASYIDKIVVKYLMQNSKRGLLPFRHGVTLSKEQCPKTPQDVEEMRCYVLNLTSVMRRTRDYMLVYGSKDLILTGYTDSDFQTDRDSRKSTSGSVFTLNGGALVWRSIKQGCIADSTMEAEYFAACEVAKEAVWLRKFLIDLEVVPNMLKPITLYCDNSGPVANSREPRSHKRGKHIEHKYHLIREIVHRGDVIVTQIASTHNVADPFTKPLTAKVFEGHLESLGLRDMPHLT
ncbi:gag/pol protein [Cucumis melo var. makuwa]|uniref:Gag/pol protein n=1 Tax=Cucumis melo var. makuwa TaxID=1194695 RepID=A0A5A7VH46_CUCMM|nr:gag/pol protein [Cucumis melo var. makuwa]